MTFPGGIRPESHLKIANKNVEKIRIEYFGGQLLMETFWWKSGGKYSVENCWWKIFGRKGGDQLTGGPS